MWKLFGVNITYLCVLSRGKSSVRQHFHPLFLFAVSCDFGLPAGRRGVKGDSWNKLPAAGISTQRELTLTLNTLSSHWLWEETAPSLCLHFLGHPWPNPPVSVPGCRSRVWGCRGAAPGQCRAKTAHAPTLLAPLLGWGQIPFTELEGETLGTVERVSVVPLSSQDCLDEDTAVWLVD